MTGEASAEDLGSLQKELDKANEMAFLALQTATDAVAAAAVALRLMESLAITSAERAVLEKAKNLLLAAESRVDDWTKS